MRSDQRSLLCARVAFHENAFTHTHKIIPQLTFQAALQLHCNAIVSAFVIHCCRKRTGKQADTHRARIRFVAL